MRLCDGQDKRDSTPSTCDVITGGLLRRLKTRDEPLDDTFEKKRINVAKNLTPTSIVANAIAAQKLPTALTWSRVFSPSVAPSFSGKLVRVNKSDGCKYQTMTRGLASGEITTKSLTLVSGFGLDKSCQFSLRAPVILLPGLKILKHILQLGLEPPQYVIYQATEFIATCNGISLPKAHDCANRLQSYLTRFVKEYHADVSQYVKFEIGLAHTQKCREALRRTGQKIDAVALEIPVIGNIISSLRESGMRHARRAEAGEEYLAANLFYSEVLRHEWPLSYDKETSRQWILPVGGENGRRFFQILGAMNDARIIPLITGMGIKSAYYPFTDEGDISDLMDDDGEMAVSKSIANDFECLRKNGTGRLQLMQLLKQ